MTEQPDERDPWTPRIIACTIEVHRVLGPGQVESAYAHCLCHELRQAGLQFTREVALPVVYKGLKIDCNFRMDLIVENQVILELKSAAQILPIHKAQLLTYLRLSGIRLGLILNFNETLMKNGIVRLIQSKRDLS
jgi:GxxExxY protein